MFQFPGLAPSKGDGIAPAGFPHSDTPGSTLACNSPRLFAACHVLLRRSVPRHPPCALTRLTSPLPSTGRDRPRRRVVHPRIIVHRARPPSPPTTYARPPSIGWPERPKALILPSTLIFKHLGACQRASSRIRAQADPIGAARKDLKGSQAEVEVNTPGTCSYRLRIPPASRNSLTSDPVT